MTGPDGDLSSPALPGNSGPAMLDPSGKFWMCSQCHTSGGSKMFHSRQAANGHMQVHTKRAKQQVEGGASSLAAEAQRKRHWDFDLNEKAPDVHEEQHEEPSRTWMNLGQKAGAEGGKKKRKEEVSYASGMSQSCSLSGKQFKSHQACGGHMRVHNNQPQRQVQQVHEEKEKKLARTSPKLGQCPLNKTEGRETKGDGSAVAEGGASLAAAEAERKKKHSKFDLNKDAPLDDDNDAEEGA